jgi:uncharacterized DUF497 family protein
MAELTFEWDEEKNAANVKNHGIDFLDAALCRAYLRKSDD